MEGDEDDDSSSDESDEEGEPTWTHGKDTEDLQPIEEEPKPKKPEKVVDDDGFELVQTRRRKR